MRETAVDAVEHLEQPGSSAAPHLAPFAGHQQLELVRDHLTEQRLARPEPAVDRGSAEPELSGDDRQIDPLAGQVLVAGHAQHILRDAAAGLPLFARVATAMPEL